MDSAKLVKNRGGRPKGSGGTMNHARVKNPGRRPRTMFRFLNAEHYSLVELAREKSGMSMNAWMIMATRDAARRQLDLQDSDD